VFTSQKSYAAQVEATETEIICNLCRKTHVARRKYELRFTMNEVMQFTTNL